MAGDFLFDDFVNLNALGRYGGVQDLPTLLLYLTSGVADPTGRPVAMASFLIDARDWPANPLPFKRTNLIIHLSNGLLLYGVLTALGRRLSLDTGRIRLAAVIATALWLLNPLWVSTVLYVIQRHAMLATLFVLAGIRAWIGSRNAFDSDDSKRGWLLGLLAVPVLGMLAGLSKANGFLLPALLAVLELSVLRSRRFPTRGQVWARRLFVWLPLLGLLTYLAWSATQTGLAGTEGRPWTLGERLRTQPRVLCEYLHHILLPGLNATGVFADGFTVSRSWHTPWTTLPSMFAIGILAALSWKVRRTLPVLAAAVGFFLAGHLIESSVVMLELYFEHRNYLPAALVFWPLAWWVASPGRYRHILLAGVTGYACLMLLTTSAQARLWGNPLTLALVWADQHPSSARAQAHAAHQEAAAGRVREAEHRMASLLKTRPQDPQIALNWLNFRCDQAQAGPDDVGRAAYAISASGGLSQDINYRWLSAVLPPRSAAPCATLPEAQLQILLLESIVDGPLSSAETEARRQHLLGIFALRQGRCEDALAAFKQRIDAQPRPEFAHTQTGLLATHCSAEAGLANLDHYLDSNRTSESAASPVLRLRDKFADYTGFWETEWEQLRTTLEEEILLDSALPAAPLDQLPDPQ